MMIEVTKDVEKILNIFFAKKMLAKCKKMKNLSDGFPGGSLFIIFPCAL